MVIYYIYCWCVKAVVLGLVIEIGCLSVYLWLRSPIVAWFGVFWEVSRVWVESGVAYVRVE